MENVILVVLLILALCLIGVVLLQRSEGGGLGIGGGGGGGAVSARGAATALGKLTWILGAAFMVMCLAMTILSARNSEDTSVIDRLGVDAPITDDGPALPPVDELLPPVSGDSPLLPPRADE